MPTKPPLLLMPFAGVLPSRDKAHLVATRSYMSYSDYELKDKLSRNPYSYLHVIHPQGDLESSQDLGAVRQAYSTVVERGWLERDEQDHYYILRQSGPMGSCTGVIGLVPTSVAKSGRIKVHEATLANREALFARYLSEVGLNAEPTLLAYPPNGAVETVISKVTVLHADLDFTTADGIRHTLWRPSQGDMAQLKAAFETVEHAYIADGHHRVASSIKMAESHPNRGAAHAFMALLVSGDSLMFRGFHRTVEVKDRQLCEKVLARLPQLNGAVWSDGFQELQPSEDCIRLRGAISGTLHINEALAAQGITAAEWLQSEVLQPLFDISEPRTDRRLNYIPGDLAHDELEAATRDQDRLAFIMPPMTFEGLQAVADAGRHLPPKSTWIAPKLRSGMTLFDFGSTS